MDTETERRRQLARDRASAELQQRLRSLNARKPKDLKFTRTRDRGWRGNGFGTAPAAWQATWRGEVVGTYDPEQSSRRGITLRGKPTPMLGSYTLWRVAVIESVLAETEAAEQ